MKYRISVVIPTYNPRWDYLQAAMEGLQAQTLSPSNWGLVVVDNRSSPPLKGRLDLSWHPNARIVLENDLGLTRARIAGFRETESDIVVLVDDDNVIAPDYLEQALAIETAFPLLGTWSGHQVLEYERPDFSLPEDLEHLVGGRRVREAVWSNDIRHHASTPWGSGMSIRRTAIEAYLRKIRDDPRRIALDLKGVQRYYGGDTDIAFVGCAIGLGKGVFPQLKLKHLITGDRCSEDFLVRVAEGRSYSGVIHEYLLTGKRLGPRTDWRGRVTRALRRMSMSPLQRRLDDAQQRGEAIGARALESVGAPADTSG